MPHDAVLKSIFEQKLPTEVTVSRLLEAIPHLNHDSLVQLAIYLAVEM